jgi:hypothetical protein
LILTHEFPLFAAHSSLTNIHTHSSSWYVKFSSWGHQRR